MKQEKFNSLMVAIVAIAAVFGFVSIVWASFTQTLTISSYNATIQPSKWDVKFGTVSALTTTGTATGTAPTGSGTDKLSGFEVGLMTPGDSVSFTVPMENNGTYAAKITGITLPTIGTLSSAADSVQQQSTDITNITPYISVTFTYEDGTALAVNDPLAAATVSGGVTTPGSRTVKMTVTLDANTPADKLPTAAITVPITATTVTFGQA